MNYRYSLICLFVGSFIGCTSTNEVSYEERANQQNNISIEQLTNRTAENTNTAIKSDHKTSQLTDLVNVTELTNYIEEALQHNPSFQQSVIALNITYANRLATCFDS